MTRFPIKDFDIPQSKKNTIQLAWDILYELKRGKNILVHCAGGNGRTGTVLYAVYKLINDIGLWDVTKTNKELLSDLRAIKSRYVERKKQEDFVCGLDFFNEVKTAENAKMVFRAKYRPSLHGSREGGKLGDNRGRRLANHGGSRVINRILREMERAQRI